MTPNSQSHDDWTIHSINIHGVFFERWCQKVISDTNGWSVKSTNYPVEFPPPNGPIRGKESSLDIRVEKDFPDFRATFLIECKKNNPEFVNWIFFPKQLTTTKDSFVISEIKNKPRTSPKTGWEVDSSMLPLENGFTLADEARKTRGDYSQKDDRSKTKTSNAAIQNAAYQIALAKQAIVFEDLGLSRKLGTAPTPPQMPWKKQWYFPLIVTSAHLFVCEFDAKDVNPLTGEIPYGKPTIEEVSQIVYEYSIPRHLQGSPKDIVAASNANLLDMFTKMHILVEHSGQFQKFLQDFSF